jgi:Dolichyl-phosphate-mannose-protein mannosyltransferase
LPRPALDSRRALLFLTGAAFLARAAYLLLEPRCELVGDEPSWIAFSTKVLKHPQYLWPLGNRLVFYPPVYDYFIAVLRLVFGSLAAVQWAQVVLGALLVPAVGRSGLRAFGPRVGVAAAALTAFYPELLWYPAHFWSETVFLFLLWWAIERTLEADATRSSRTAAVAGLLWGLSALTRELSLYLVPLVVLWLVRPAAGTRPAAGSWRRASALLVALILSIVPWTVRNAIKFHAFIPVSTLGGLNLWQGNTTLTHVRIYEILDTVGGPIEQDRYCRQMAWRAIRDRQPWWIFEKLGAEMPEFWKAGSEVIDHLEGREACGPLPPRTSALLELAFVGPYLVLLGFFLVGLARLRPSSGGWLLLALLGAYNLAHVVAYATTRFRVPVLPIVFMVAAAAAVGGGERGLAPLRGRRLVLVALLVVVALLTLAPGMPELVTWSLITGRPVA